MAIALKDTPRFEDQLVTYQNQKLWWLLIGASVLLCAALTVIAVQALRPGPPPYVLEINKATGEPIGAVAPVLGTQIIPDPAIRWELKEFIEYAFRVDKDFDEEKAAPHHVYATTTGQAASALTAWYRADRRMIPSSPTRKVGKRSAHSGKTHFERSQPKC